MLPHHHKMVRNAPLSDRSLTLVRLYITAFEAFKLIVCLQTVVDLSTIPDRAPRPIVISPDGQVRFLRTPFLKYLRKLLPRLSHMPLITGFGDKIMWTAGPDVSKESSSAQWRDQLKGWSLALRAPFELWIRSYITYPGVHRYVRAFGSPPLVGDDETVTWDLRSRVLPPRYFQERCLKARLAILQFPLGLNEEVNFSLYDIREFLPEALRPVPFVRHGCYLHLRRLRIARKL